MNWTMDEWWLRRWVLMTWRDIISNVLWVLLLGGMDEAVLGRPKVPSQSSHIGPDRDDPSPMSLRLMADGEGDEVSKVEDMPIPQGWRKSQCLGGARIAGGRGRDDTTKAELDRSRIVEVGHYGLKMERQAEFQYELEIRRLNDLKEEPPRGTWRNGCLISVVGPEDDTTPLLFFEAGTSVFLPREDDIVPTLKSRSSTNTSQK
ncbi:hypothetical protein GOBAR_AA13235 [Gossypium barbadense]|uniref:Uncharacterized protein n=1 Tax=Gossypium barbadense TaxID=3634 RepID=A0A2P5XVX2_GOSBA|nr:hypothetical protein GOBAR_AA13235 [Gossypium barbadense]